MTAKNNSSRGRQERGSDSNDKRAKSSSSNPSSKARTGKSKDKNFRPHPEKVKSFKKAPSEIKKPKVSEGIRLNKYISNSGICSRREADTYIRSGSAMVNGKIITEMGYQVKPTDIVKFDDVVITPEAKRYVLLNKPKNFITSMSDENGRKTVMELVHKASKERIYPVGRLDRMTTGLLMFTNDGEMAKKLTHPKHEVRKLYHVTLDKKLSTADLYKIAENFVLDGKMVFVDKISYIEDKPKFEIGIEIHSGRNRIVRRIFEHFGYKVVKLDRVVFAGLTKKNLGRGVWRHLTEQEVNNLKMI
jgi:23S rRNA pseudouridine2605 synthase